MFKAHSPDLSSFTCAQTQIFKTMTFWHQADQHVQASSYTFFITCFNNNIIICRYFFLKP